MPAFHPLRSPVGVAVAEALSKEMNPRQIASNIARSRVSEMPESRAFLNPDFHPSAEMAFDEIALTIPFFRIVLSA